MVFQLNFHVGGWRQAGYLAAAGLFALQYNFERLAKDHERALKLEQHLKALKVKITTPVETNMV